MEEEFNWKEKSIIKMAEAVLNVPCAWWHGEELVEIVEKVISLSEVNASVVLREISVDNGITKYNVYLHFSGHREAHVGVVAIED